MRSRRPNNKLWHQAGSTRQRGRSGRVRQLSLILSLQVVCVGVGVWIHDRYVINAVTEAVFEEARVELRANLGRLSGTFADLELGASGAKTLSLEELATRVAQATPLLTGGLILVDAKWRYHAGTIGPRAMAAAHPSQGEPLQFTEQRTRSRGRNGRMEGELLLADGPHLALAQPVPGKHMWIVSHQPRRPFAARAATLLDSVPMATVVTVVWISMLLSIAVYMVVSQFYDKLAGERERADAESMRRMDALVRTRDAVIFGLAKLADSRDPETGDHLERLSVYSATLAAALSRHDDYTHEITPAFMKLIGISSALHDIGKVGIEDSILLKPGPLTPAERERMQQHTLIGGECLRELERRLGSSNFLEMARKIAFAHHEHWDGGGYPHGLAGKDIPFSARIVAIVDVYDALSTRRVYKDAFPHERCVAIIRDGAGTQFDPDLVNVWLTITGRFRDLAARYRGDEPAQTQELEPAVLQFQMQVTAVEEQEEPERLVGSGV